MYAKQDTQKNNPSTLRIEITMNSIADIEPLLLLLRQQRLLLMDAAADVEPLLLLLRQQRLLLMDAAADVEPLLLLLRQQRLLLMDAAADVEPLLLLFGDGYVGGLGEERLEQWADVDGDSSDHS